MERAARRRARQREDALHARAQGQAGARRPRSTARPRRCAARRPPKPRRASRSSPREAQEEAMKHVLPFKQRQIEQRQLEAEAETGSRASRRAEGSAQARRIEAGGEADARAEARRRRGLSAREGRQGERRADGARRRAGHAASAADPEDAGRQALRQDPGDHRAAARRDGGFIGATLLGGRTRSKCTRVFRCSSRCIVGRVLGRGAAALAIVVQDRRRRCALRRATRRSSRRCSGRARCSRCAASGSTTCRSRTTRASAAASCARRRCGASP